MLFANELKKPERIAIIQMMEGLNDAEKELALKTLLRINSVKEFLDLGIVTLKDLDATKIENQ